MSDSQLKEIVAASRRMRLIQAEMSLAFPCYLGSSLSVTDILATLYFGVMNVSADRPDDPARDVLVLSKGHASPALYAALHLRGYLEKDELLRHSTVDSRVYYHPNAKIPGIELATGSLGQGLSFGVGTALAQKQDGRRSRTFVILGDGELNEGSNWEAILAAPALGLGNLVAIVDRNGIQANLPTEQLIPLEDLEAKWKAFGWRTRTVDGHSIPQLRKVLAAPAKAQSRPLVVIAKTVRNKGISFQENRIDAWNVQLSEEDYARACAEIRGPAMPTRRKTAGRSKHGLEE